MIHANLMSLYCNNSTVFINRFECGLYSMNSYKIVVSLEIKNLLELKFIIDNYTIIENNFDNNIFDKYLHNYKNNSLSLSYDDFIKLKEIIDYNHLKILNIGLLLNLPINIYYEEFESIFIKNIEENYPHYENF